MSFYRQQKRIVVLFISFVLVFLGLLAHLGYWQLVLGDKLAGQAFNRQSKSVSLENVPRGLILDRNGRPLTDPHIAQRLVIFPYLLKNKAVVIAEIAALLKTDKSGLEKKIEALPVVLPNALNHEQAKTIRKKSFPGVVVMPCLVRYGPKALATHLVGYVDQIYDRGEWERLRKNSGKKYSLGDLVGKEGLEKTFENDLKGTAPERVGRVYLDGERRFLPGLGYKVEETLVDPGRANLVTTIDEKVQRIVEEVMDMPADSGEAPTEGLKETGHEEKRLVEDGAVVVLDVKTGEVLAMASRPRYDQNRPLTHEEGAFLNQGLQKYPPGSVFKVVSAAAALDEKIVSEEDLFLCAGAKDPYVGCVKEEGHGAITFAEALAESCNPTFARVGLRLGGDKLYDYAVGMGFDPKKLALIRERDNVVNGTIGQWPVEASPLEVAAMMNTVAAGGYYRQPRTVLNLQSSDGKLLKKFPDGEGRRIFSVDTAQRLKKMLQDVVGNGTGKKAQVKALDVAGKTGSAQVKKGGLTHAWFAGFAPVANPRYTVVVFLKEGGAGGEKGAPVFREIIEKLFD